MNVVDALIEKKRVTPQQLADAQARSRQDGSRIDRALISMGFIDEEEILKIASEQLFIPFTDLANVRIPREAIDAIETLDVA